MSEHSDPSSEHIVLDGHGLARALPFGSYPLTDVQKKIRKVFFNTPLGYSRLRRPFIERFKRDCSSGPVDATLFGLKVRFYPHDNQTDAKSAVCGACYNHRELKWLRRHLPKGGTFVDVGANMGFFSLYAAQRDARVIAIEPNPVLFGRLATNMRLNGMRADLLRVAVGDQEGSGQLVQVNGDFGGGRMGAGHGAPVQIRPLLDILQRCDVTAVHALKIDIEGYEDRALLPFFREAPATFWPDHLIMEDTEHGRWAQDVFPVLRRCGYERRARSRGNILLSRF
ncbi:FkbM family methyltransferase [Gluconobacter cerinus]|uniref:FkbM family methyltransferase n=1 Tax=Gluconobacter cerinus TaxID=38307 RepID=UPI001B8A9F8C|nr:FkbM family methyltransferase [Gluconobacter cerinus]MBS1069826.1 FkbM family methyltransferase [Gluconobacter cerinus]